MPNDLSDIKPKEISLVDKPANQKSFLFFKRQKGVKMPENTGELNVSDVPATVLKKFIEDMKPSVEKLVSLTTNLETLQKGEENKDGGSDDVSKEFASIKKSLDDLVEKCSNIEKNSKEGKMPEEDKSKEIPETFAKMMEEFNKKIDGLGEKITKMEEGNKESDKDKDTKTNDDVKKDDKKEDKKDDKTIDADAIVEKVQKSLMEQVEKALDKRAENLVGLFQEAAKEEFKGLFESVEANKNELSKFKKALSGGEPEEDAGGEEYIRNYGDQEREDVANVEHKDNPFHSMFAHIDSRTS